MSSFFRPYEGSRPFLFISYAHRQSDEVVETIRILHEKGWRLWYDEGIPAGSDWPANIAQHMQSCERVIFFLSARAMESANCFSEMSNAARQKKPILIVRLEDAAIEGKWKELLDGRPEIPLLATAEERASSILRSGFLPRRFRQSWTEGIPWRVLGFAASLLFFVAAAGALAALASGRWSLTGQPAKAAEAPEPRAAVTPAPIVELGEAERYFAVSFPDSQQERAIRRALDNTAEAIYRWQLAEITELYFCGNMTAGSLENISFDRDGVCRVNGAPVIEGKVTDLSLIADMLRLERLALICQPMEDLSGLNGHVLLKELSLAGSTVDSLPENLDLPALETLHLEHTAVTDLTPLETLPNLKTVTVSRDMLPLTWSKNAGFAVILVIDK